jgi:membrane protease YdiL (CAAX protease family)
VPEERPQPAASGWLLLFSAAAPFVAKVLSLAVHAASYPAQSAYKLLQLVVPVLWRRRYSGKRGLAALWPIDEPLPGMATWGLAVAAALVLSGAAVATLLLCADALGLDPMALRQQIDARFGMTPGRALAVVLYLFTINAALEELHFRAWLDRELSVRLGHALGICASACTFAAMHLLIFAAMPGFGPVQLALVFIALFVAGATWSLIARRRGGIHAAWLSHGLTDATLLFWGLLWLGYL